MINLNHIHSLTDFQRNAKGFLTQLKETKTPVVLTVNGQASVVLQDAQSYQELLDRLEYAESVAGLVKSLEEFERGEGMPLKEAFDKLRKKHGIQS